MVRIKKFTIKNFQSIKYLELNFDEYGVYHLAGDNNIGKSAVTQALKAHFMNVNNQAYKEYLRDDEDTFETIMEDYDGNITHLSRGGVDFYAWTIDGVSDRLDSTNGKVPDNLVEYFNLYIDEKDKENLNFRLDIDSIIFSKTSGQSNYRILQEALGTIDFAKGLKEAKAEKKELGTQIKTRTLYKQKLEEDLGTEEEDLNNYRSNLEQVNAIANSVTGAKERYDKLVSIKDKYKEARELTLALKSLGSLDSIDIDSMDADYRILRKLVTVKGYYNAVAEDNALLDKLGNVSSINTDDMEQKLNTLAKLVNLSNLFNESSNLKSQITDFSTLDLDDLFNTFDTLYTLIKLKGLYIELKDYNDSLGTVQEEVTALENQEIEFLSKFDVCWVCKQAMPDASSIVHSH